jgi:large subunit ribosomal protein L6
MSRIGKIPVKIPQGVKVAIGEDTITVEGPKGKLTQQYHQVISFKAEGAEVVVTRANDEKQTRAFHGLYRNLLNNMIVGVSTGFTRSLIITGVGFRAEVKGDILTMNLGYSNDINVLVPKGLSVTADANGKVVVSGIDKQQVGEFASQIRKLRLPEPYKGKGIRYEDETIRRKVGKSGVK